MVFVRRLAYVASLVLIPACGQSLNKPPGNGGGTDGGTIVSKDLAGVDAAPAAVIDMAGFNQVGSPTIVITAPVAGAEVHGDVMTVTATITSPTNALIQASSVLVTVTPPGGAVATAPLTLTPIANVYSGTVSLPDNASGAGTFSVGASDINGLKGSAQGTYVHDHGPILSFVAPTGTTLVKGTQTITVEITVEDSLHPITDIAKVSAGIRALGDIKLASVAGANPFTVVAMVDLKTYDNPELDGSQLIKAQAINSAGTIGSKTQQITVDNVGPTFTNVTPVSTKTAFVSGVTDISVDIDDLSGVDDSTVVAVWGGDAADYSVPLTRTSMASKTYTGSFDVRSLGTSYVHPVFSIRARDTLGNPAEYVDSFFVDNTRPWLTMDHLLSVRVAQLDTAVNKESCSALFSPLGDDVATEGKATQLAITLRARVEDHGNTEPGLTVEHVSGIDLSPAANAVVMYVIEDDGTTPLAVDTDADGICDDVNPQLPPTTSIVLPGEALSLSLTPIIGTGVPDFTPTGASPSGICEEFGQAGTTFAGLGICDATPLIYNIQGVSAESEIFTLPPVVGDKVNCVGTQLDSYNHNLRGPICVVTRAVDNSGNINVSYPLHLCVIDPASPHNCDSYVATATHCTGVWNKVTQQLGAGFCAAPVAGQGTFANGEILVTP
jgi:hypothetical protein